MQTPEPTDSPSPFDLPPQAWNADRQGTLFEHLADMLESVTAEEGETYLETGLHTPAGYPELVGLGELRHMCLKRARDIRAEQSRRN